MGLISLGIAGEAQPRLRRPRRGTVAHQMLLHLRRRCKEQGCASVAIRRNNNWSFFLSFLANEESGTGGESRMQLATEDTALGTSAKGFCPQAVARSLPGCFGEATLPWLAAGPAGKAGSSTGHSDAHAKHMQPTGSPAKPPCPYQLEVTQVRVAAQLLSLGPVLEAGQISHSPSLPCWGMWWPCECRAVASTGGATAQQGNGVFLLRQLCNRFSGGADCKLQS